jgi:LacI family transcriptional regulator
MSGPTLKDVAKMAGVSIGTASQAINNRPNVMPETRAKVIDAARSLGYPFRDPESDPCESKLSLIGMLVKHDYGQPFSVNPFYSYIQMGIENECRKRSIKLMYANVEVDRDNRPVEWPLMLREEGLDGLLLLGMLIDQQNAAFIKARKLPVVLIDSYAPGSGYDMVITDNVEGSRLAVNYLLDQGHTDIALLGWHPYTAPSMNERRIGYERALRERGISQTYIQESDPDRTKTKKAVQTLLQHSPQVSAVFAVNDEAALGVIHGVRDLGLRVPEDVSVVGFDNIDLARDIMPPLTTIHVPKSWLGSIGVRMLSDRASNLNQPLLTVTVAVSLIERGSVQKLIR